MSILHGPVKSTYPQSTHDLPAKKANHSHLAVGEMPSTHITMNKMVSELAWILLIFSYI